MAKQYIKTHSNYTLRKRHQDTDKGTVYERDFVTIGGVSAPSNGQRPMYNSGTFILTTNNERPTARDYVLSDWLETSDGKTTWKLEDTLISDPNNSNDYLSLPYKNDIYALKDFAYYGSLSELVRTSVTNIINLFPGELNIPTYSSGDTETGYNATYYKTVNGETEEITIGDAENNFLLNNPFNINLHSDYVALEDWETNPLKYFYGDGYKQYEIGVTEITSASTVTSFYDITSYSISSATNNNIEDDEKESSLTQKYCVGELISKVELGYNKTNLKIKVYQGEQDNFIYLVDSRAVEDHICIRPKSEHYHNFLASLNRLEQILMNDLSTPRYTAEFEILEESSFGYDQYIDIFTFPTDFNGYNIDISENSLNAYLDKFLNITNFYDDRFCDNLYRSMTHEAIKNLDWSFNQAYTQGNETNYSIGGGRVKNALRLFGREFDEIKQHADALKNYNTITYDDKNNVPDYFLSDQVEMEGWDFVNIYPKELSAYYLEERKIEQDEKCGKVGTIKEEKVLVDLLKLKDKNEKLILYSQDNVNQIEIKSDSDSEYKHLYRVFADNLNLDNINPYLADYTALADVTICNCSDYYNYLNEQPKQYTDETEYSVPQVNTHFMKMLKLNSRSILSRKSTIEGIESILSLFGLKSKRWCESHYNNTLSSTTSNTENNTCEIKNKTVEHITIYQEKVDYEIEEYICEVDPIKLEINSYGDCETTIIDYINRAKYNTYSEDLSTSTPTPYRGLLVKYEEKDGSHYLYPYFNSNKEQDGNPYYQMKGGWLNKTPFMFDNNNNIVSSTTSNKLFTETVRKIKTVNSINELLTIPYGSLKDGLIYYVNEDLKKENYIFFDAVAYPLILDNNNNSYFNANIYNHSILLGNKLYSGEFTVWDPNMAKNDSVTITSRTYNLSYMDDGVLPCYVLDENGMFKGQFTSTLYDDVEVLDTLPTSNVAVLFNGTLKYPTNEEDAKKGSNYFQYHDNENISPLGGWEQIYEDDDEYFIINTIRDYYKGNNPHCGWFNYDDGENYLSYFGQLFKDAIDNNTINYKCLDKLGINDREKIENLIKSIGFFNTSNCASLEEIKHEKIYNSCETYAKTSSTLTIDDKYKFSSIQIYDEFSLVTPTAFTKYQAPKEIGYHGEYPSPSTTSAYSDIIGKINSGKCSTDLVKNNSVENLTPITSVTTITGDTTNYTINFNEQDKDQKYSSDQIINTKRLKIIFYLDLVEDMKNVYKNKNDLEIIKYYDSVIVPYVEQMVPSTTILEIQYEKKSKVESDE